MYKKNYQQLYGLKIDMFFRIQQLIIYYINKINKLINDV